MNLIQDDTQLKIGLLTLNTAIQTDLSEFRKMGNPLRTTNSFSLISDEISLRGVLLLQSRELLKEMYVEKNMPAQAIGIELGISHQAVLEALYRHKIIKSDEVRRGQTPFGLEYKEGQLKENQSEMQILEVIKQMVANDLSFNEIARQLNHHMIPAKKNGAWYSATVGEIAQRLIAE